MIIRIINKAIGSRFIDPPPPDDPLPPDDPPPPGLEPPFRYNDDV